jgi:hypothetical protein
MASGFWKAVSCINCMTLGAVAMKESYLAFSPSVSGPRGTSAGDKKD